MNTVNNACFSDLCLKSYPCMWWIWICVLSFMMIMVAVNTGLCLDSKDLIRLKKNGVSDQTIQLVIREKVIETCLLTVQDIIDMKRAGLKDDTIRKLIKEESFIKASQPVIYGNNIKSIRFTTAKDIIKLKKAGISDDIIKAVIVYCAQDTSEEERIRSWEFLKSMGLIIDKRQTP